MDTFSFKGKVIVVSRGIGVLGDAFIKGIVEAGGKVGILGHNESLVRQRADETNKGSNGEKPLR